MMFDDECATRYDPETAKGLTLEALEEAVRMVEEKAPKIGGIAAHEIGAIVIPGEMCEDGKVRPIWAWWRQIEAEARAPENMMAWLSGWPVLVIEYPEGVATDSIGVVPKSAIQFFRKIGVDIEAGITELLKGQDLFEAALAVLIDRRGGFGVCLLDKTVPTVKIEEAPCEDPIRFDEAYSYTFRCHQCGVTLDGASVFAKARGLCDVCMGLNQFPGPI